MLESTEIGLQSAVQQLWKSINRLRQDSSDITETLDSVLTEIRNVHAEMVKYLYIHTHNIVTDYYVLHRCLQNQI